MYPSSFSFRFSYSKLLIQLCHLIYPLCRYKTNTYFLTVPEKEPFLIEELKSQFPTIFAGRSAACLVKTNLSCEHPLPPLAFAKYETRKHQQKQIKMNKRKKRKNKTMKINRNGLLFYRQIIPAIFILTKQGSNASWAKETGLFEL